MTQSERGSYNHAKIDIFIDKVQENTHQFIIHMSTNSSFSCRLNCNLQCLIVVMVNRTIPVVLGHMITWLVGDCVTHLKLLKGVSKHRVIFEGLI